jgi:mannose-6-phosphate isomerase-like protein (cupin superfamily)
MDAAIGSTSRLIEAGGGDAIWFFGSLIEIKADGHADANAYDFFDMTMPVGYAPPLHAHREEDEAFFLLEGELALVCGEDRARLKPGGFVHLPKGIPHSFRVEGEHPARVLVFSVPSGVLSFFAAIGEPATARILPPVDPHDVERMQAAADKYGIELLGPPPF